MSYYTWITENMAIGELNSTYEPFDTIINLAYINPSFNNGLQHRETRKTVKDSKVIYEFGLYDSDEDVDYLSTILVNLFEILQPSQLNIKILFHCQSGKSRSVSVALAYLCKRYSLEVDDALNHIKQRRPVANPRASFVQTVKKIIML